MSKAAVAISLLALGGSAFTAWKTGALCGACGAGAPAGDRLAPDEVASLSARLRALEDQVAASSRGPAPLTAAPSPASDAPAGLAAAPRPASGSPSAATLPPPEASAIEKRLAELEQAVAATRTQAEGAMPAHVLSGGISNRFYGSVADAAKDLDLSPRQKDDFDRAVADAKREIDELKKIPDSDGKTWADIEDDAMPKPGEGLGKLDLGALIGFPSRKIPGRTETFGQAQRRVQAAAKTRMRETLTPDQQKKFDKAHVDPMLGGSSGAMISFDFATDVTETPAR